MNSKRFALIVALIFTISFVWIKAFHMPKNVIGYDTLGYYLYFPALQLHNDIGLKDRKWLEDANNKENLTPWFYQFYQEEGNENWIIKYTPGWIVMHYPFVLSGHIYAKVNSLPTDGFGKPYQMGLLAGSFFYIFLGYYFMVLALAKLFSNATAFWLAALLTVGTNVLHMFGIGPLAIHTVIFALNGVILWLVVKYQDNPTFGTRFFGGLLVGLIALSRPTDVFSGVFLLAFWLSWPIKFNAELFRKILPVGLGFMLPILPLLIYWKFVSGSFFINSYGNNPGEGLDLFTPYILEFLFSARKGWFVFTPIVILFIPGFVYLYRKEKTWFWPTLIYSLLMLWVTASWTNWWYASGSYSARSIIPSLVFLAVPLGFLLEKIRTRGFVRQTLNYALIAALLFINLFYAWQFEHYILTAERNTWPYLFKTFLKTKAPEGSANLLAIDRANVTWDMVPNKDEYSYNGLAFYDFEEVGNSNSIPGVCGKSGLLTQENAFSSGAEVPYGVITDKDHIYVRIKGWAFIPDTSKIKNTELLAVIHYWHGRKPYGYNSTRIQLKNVIGWQSFEVTSISPVIRSSSDKMKSYLWFPKGDTVAIDNIQIGAYVPNFQHWP